MNKLFLIRHGKTNYSEEHLYCGKSDVPLCQKGIEELKQKKSLNLYPALNDDMKLCCSSLLRTRQTLEIIYPNMPYSVFEGFNEINFGIFEGHSYNDLKDSPQYQTWISGNNFLNVCPNGESFYLEKNI